MSKTRWIVAVDGPAGSGKSSICREVAQTLGWSYLNTGFIYRAVAYLVYSNGGEPSGEEVEVAQRVAEIQRGLSWKNNQMLYQGENISSFLETREVAEWASIVAKMPEVRRVLIPLQRDLASEVGTEGVLVDGRDIGTVIFPDANLKIFLTASLEKRAERRLAQLGLGDADPSQMIAEIRRRDERDAGRGVAPLKQAPDAHLVDTSDLSYKETLATVLGLIQAHCSTFDR